MLRESDFQKRVRIILRRRILHCTKRMPPCIFETTLHFLLVCFCFVEVRFSPLVCPLLTTAKTCASLNPRCGTCPLFRPCSDEGRRFRFDLAIVDDG